ncbi:hypothetical protein JCM19000A_24490 [Silvimonas sp. JCM 19000]
MQKRPSAIAAPAQQQGIVLVVTLVALVLLLLTTVALMRSSQNALTTSGNMAFKRDQTNAAEQGIVAARTWIANASASTLMTTSATNNYSSVRLATSKYGVPDELRNAASTYTATASKAIDVHGDGSVMVYYIIDRMCDSSNAGLAIDSTKCTLLQNSAASPGAQVGNVGEGEVGSAAQAIYRISVRVDGPRSTQTFVQTTVAK